MLKGNGQETTLTAFVYTGLYLTTSETEKCHAAGQPWPGTSSTVEGRQIRLRCSGLLSAV